MSYVSFVSSQILHLDLVVDGCIDELMQVRIDDQVDGIEKLVRAIAVRNALEAKYVTSDDTSGIFALGTAVASKEGLNEYYSELTRMETVLDKGGSLLLPRSTVGGASAGRGFVEDRSSWMDADVAALTHSTGEGLLRGDWLLEGIIGTIEAGALIDGAIHGTSGDTLASATISTSNVLVNGLGGSVGFGENLLPRNDDESTIAIDITPVFGPLGLNFFGANRTHLYVNNNGNVTFVAPLFEYTPGLITAGTDNPIIAPFWADVDTRGLGAVATPGGNSLGTNQVYYDLDTVNKVFTVTWDDVGYFNRRIDKLNAFQLQLVDRSGGDFDIVFRYEAVNWTTGESSGGVDGLGGIVARMGYSAGNGTDYFELAASGDQERVLAIDSTPGNTGSPGVYVFSVDNGVVLPSLSIAATVADRAEGNIGTTPFTFTVTRSGSTTGMTTVDWRVGPSNVSPSADALDFGGAFPSGTLTFTANQLTSTIVVNVVADLDYEGGGLAENFTVTLSNPSGGATLSVSAAAGRIQNDDRPIIGTPGDDTLIGNDGADLIDGTSGNDILNGGNGNDTLIGGPGNDTLIGGGNTDTADYSDAPGPVTVNLGAGTATGAAGDDTLIGIENVIGSAFADTLIGSDVANVIDGRGGADTMRGGLGNDIYYVDNPGDVVEEVPNVAPALTAAVLVAALEGFVDMVIAAIDYSLQNIAYVENLTLAAGGGTAGTGNELDNVLTGNELNNMLAGLAGNDTLNGGGGDDTLDGGEGTDTVTYGSSGSHYIVTRTALGYNISGPDGSDTLVGIERARFSDGGLAFDLDLHAPSGSTVRIIGAAFDAPAIAAHPDWVSIGLGFFDGGMSELEACEFVVGLLGWSNAEFVTNVYRNVVGFEPSPDQHAIYIGLLQGNGGTMMQAELLVFAADHPVNELNINLVGLQQSGVEFV